MPASVLSREPGTPQSIRTDRVLRDLPDAPEMRKAMVGIAAYFDDVATGLADTWVPEKTAERYRRVVAISTHALLFHSGQSLRQSGLEDDEIADLMARWLVVVAAA